MAGPARGLRVIEAVTAVRAVTRLGDKEVTASRLATRLGFTGSPAADLRRRPLRGERRRLQLLWLLMAEPNVIVLGRADQRPRHRDADLAGGHPDGWAGTWSSSRTTGISSSG